MSVVISQGLRISRDRAVVDEELILSRDFYANIISPENVKTIKIYRVLYPFHHRYDFYNHDLFVYQQYKQFAIKRIVRATV